MAALLSDAIPDAVVVNPIDWGAMLKQRRAPTPASGSTAAARSARRPVQLWGLPAIPSNAIAQGEALIGAFGTAARLFIREAINVRVSDATEDDFVRNRVRALAEMRAGLAVLQPTAFCVVHLKA